MSLLYWSDFWGSLQISPIAWQHIHFLGQYTFKTSEEPIDMNEILKNINWKF